MSLFITFQYRIALHIEIIQQLIRSKCIFFSFTFVTFLKIGSLNHFVAKLIF